MAKTKVSEWSTTPSSNTDIDGINIAEGCAPSGINDAIRDMMAQIRSWQSGTYGDTFNGPVNGTIGATTASTGAFTTISASGNVTLSGGTANGVAYLNGSKVVTSGSALTYNGTDFEITSGALSISGGRGSARSLRFPDWSVYNSSTGNGLVFDNGSEQMRLTSTGLGIGTSSPSTKLHVNNSTGVNTYAAFSNSNATNGLYVGTAANGDGVIGTIDAKPLLFLTGASTRATFDASGNLGLGVTPSAWGSSTKAIQNQGGALYAGGSTNQILAQNFYNNTSGVNIYSTTNAASYYLQSSGAHSWGIAPSGTAGNAITFTQAATLTAAGDYLVGRTSQFGSERVSIESASSNTLLTTYNFTATSVTHHEIRNQNGIVGSIVASGGNTSYNTSSDYRLKNITGSITTSGAYIDSLNPVEGTWKADGSTFVGLIAHQVQEASRTQVATGVKDGAEMQSMDYSSPELIANLIAEVKSLRQRVATLETK